MKYTTFAARVITCNHGFHGKSLGAERQNNEIIKAKK